MDPASDSEMQTQRMLRLRSQKRGLEDEEMGSNKHREEGSSDRILLKEMAGSVRTVIAVKEELLDHLPQYTYQEHSTQRSISHSTSATDQYDGSRSDGSGTGSTQISPSVVNFQQVKGFEDFQITVDGLILDSELLTDVKVKYYELCSSQKMFLHNHLIKGLDGKHLVTGIISETSNIADAIKSATLPHSLPNLECWDKTLKAFEGLGMNVGFLRTRVDKLVKLSCQYQTTNQSKDEKLLHLKMKMKALGDRVSAIEGLQKSIANLQESVKKLEAELDDVAGHNEEIALEFKEVAAASW